MLAEMVSCSSAASKGCRRAGLGKAAAYLDRGTDSSFISVSIWRAALLRSRSASFLMWALCVSLLALLSADASCSLDGDTAGTDCSMPGRFFFRSPGAAPGTAAEGAKGSTASSSIITSSSPSSPVRPMASWSLFAMAAASSRGVSFCLLGRILGAACGCARRLRVWRGSVDMPLAAADAAEVDAAAWLNNLLAPALLVAYTV